MADKKTNSSRKANLTCKVVGGKLVVSIGVDTLTWASRPENGGKLKGCAVCKGKEEMWAQDVAREIMREDEVGNFPLSDFLDQMMNKAADDGSGALKFPHD